MTEVLDTLVRRTRAGSAETYLLADHLDAILAASEDLKALTLDCAPPASTVTGDDIAERAERERDFMGQVRRREAAIVAHTLRARAHATAVARHDPRAKAITSLFVSGTRAFVDAIGTFAETARVAQRFDGADDMLSYLRSRGLIASDAACLTFVGTLEIDDRMLIVGAVELGVLLDHTATFLNTLELHYDLFEAADEHAERAADVA